jgi:hypothetical protein
MTNEKTAIDVCRCCRHFNGLKKNGFPKACKLKRTMGIIQCHNKSKLRQLLESKGKKV